MKALCRAPSVFPADGFSEPGVRAVFFEGPAYRGKPTRVFAWIGLPKLEPGKKAPGMVLVHGGGGTAFASWVRLWTERGYAAIAMDTCGALPKGTYGNWARNPDGGPPGWGGFDQIDQPREDQWTYHAVADAILAHSLLRSLPEVDAGRIGLTGISWGGYLTCIIAGVDSRFRFAVPVYGCGFTNEHTFAPSVLGLGPERAERWMKWWDPSSYLGSVRMPMLWVTGSNDFAYTFSALQKSYRLPRTPRTLAIWLRMPHGHGPAGEAPKEIWVYADSILKGGEPLARITSAARVGSHVAASFESRRPIVRAELNITRDTGKWPDRKWDALPAKVEGNRVTAELPSGVTVYYLNLFDDRDCCVSTEHEEMPTLSAGPWPPVATFSILGYDPATGEVGGAVQSRVFSVGNGVLWAEAGVGAAATQAIVDVSYGPQALALLRKGMAPKDVVRTVWERDPDPRPQDWTKQGRQFAVIDAKGRVAAYTGPKATPWAGDKQGRFCTAQGNILASAAVVSAMVEAFEKTQGHLSLRLMAALEAGQKAGGDKRGMQSAAMLIVKKDGGVWLHNDVVLRLQVDDSPEPLKELRRLVEKAAAQRGRR